MSPPSMAAGLTLRKAAGAASVTPAAKLSVCGGVVSGLYFCGLLTLAVLWAMGAQSERLYLVLLPSFSVTAFLYLLAGILFTRQRVGSGALWMMVAGVLSLPAGILALVVGIVLRRTVKKGGPPTPEQAREPQAVPFWGALLLLAVGVALSGYGLANAFLSQRGDGGVEFVVFGGLVALTEVYAVVKSPRDEDPGTRRKALNCGFALMLVLAVSMGSATGYFAAKEADKVVDVLRALPLFLGFPLFILLDSFSRPRLVVCPVRAALLPLGLWGTLAVARQELDLLGGAVISAGTYAAASTVLVGVVLLVRRWGAKKQKDCCNGS